MRLMIVGMGRHGKDSAADLIAKELNLRSYSSSRFAADRVIYPQRHELFTDEYLASDQIGDGPDAIPFLVTENLYDDRHNHRETWKQAICDYNKDNPARLMTGLYEHADIYVGVRARNEFEMGRAQGVFDLSIWVDASERVDYVDPTCELVAEDCDVVLNNNGSIGQLTRRVRNLCKSYRAFTRKRIKPIKDGLERIAISIVGELQ